MCVPNDVMWNTALQSSLTNRFPCAQLTLLIATQHGATALPGVWHTYLLVFAEAGAPALAAAAELLALGAEDAAGLLGAGKENKRQQDIHLF